MCRFVHIWLYIGIERGLWTLFLVWGLYCVDMCVEGEFCYLFLSVMVCLWCIVLVSGRGDVDFLRD